MSCEVVALWAQYLGSLLDIPGAVLWCALPYAVKKSNSFQFKYRQEAITYNSAVPVLVAAVVYSTVHPRQTVL